MTDRHTAYFVTLKDPIREDDAELTVAALRQIKGVLDVRPVVAGIDQMAGAFRVEADWKRALMRLVEHGPDGGRDDQ